MEEMQNISKNISNYKSITDEQLTYELQKLNEILQEQNENHFEQYCLEFKRLDLVRSLINYLKLKKNTDSRCTQLILVILHNVCSSNNQQIIDNLFNQQMHRIFLKFIVENVKGVFEINIQQDEYNYLLISLSGLSNMCQYSLQTRMSIVKLNIVYAVSDILHSKSYSKGLYQKIAFLIYNLSKFESTTEHRIVCQFYHCIVGLLEIELQQEEQDSQIVNDLVWGLAYISNVNNIVHLMIHDKVFQKLHQFYHHYTNKHEIDEVYSYIIGILCSVDQKTIKYFIESDYDYQLMQIAIHNKTKFMNKNILFVLSNLGITNNPNTQRLFQENELIEYLRLIIIHELEVDTFDFKYQIFVDLVWLFTNVLKQDQVFIKSILLDNHLLYQFLQLILKQQIVKRYEKMIDQIIEIIVNSIQFIDTQNNHKHYSREIESLLSLVNKMETEERIILKVFQQIRNDLKSMSIKGIQ